MYNEFNKCLKVLFYGAPKFDSKVNAFPTLAYTYILLFSVFAART